jgi:hypothetical protein
VKAVNKAKPTLTQLFQTNVTSIKGAAKENSLLLVVHRKPFGYFQR